MFFSSFKRAYTITRSHKTMICGETESERASSKLCVFCFDFNYFAKKCIMGICIIMQSRFIHSVRVQYSNMNTVSRHLIRIKTRNALNGLNLQIVMLLLVWILVCVENTYVHLSKIIFVTNSPFVITALNWFIITLYIAVIVHLMREWLHRAQCVSVCI